MISTRPDRLFRDLGRQPRLASLMSLYERNYCLLQKIIPVPKTLNGALESHSERDETLHLEVVEHTRYTSLLRLTYMIPLAGSPSAVPNLKVRLYHDAQVAEVLDFRGMTGGEPGPDSLLRRWTENLLLEKWLEFVDQNDHEFI